MLALLEPEAPAQVARRARVRLEAVPVRLDRELAQRPVDRAVDVVSDVTLRRINKNLDVGANLASQIHGCAI